MKVKRYPVGASNIGQLQRGRQGLTSPGYAARLAAAPYQAVAEGAQAIGAGAQRIQEAQLAEQKSNDKLLQMADVAMVRSDLQALRKQADQEKWTDEQFQESAQKRINDFVSSVDHISEQGRKDAAFRYGVEAQTLLNETALQGADIRTERTREQWVAAYDRLGAQNDYAAQLAMLDAVGQGDAPQLFEQVELQQMARGLEANIESTRLMDEYAEARALGVDDEYLVSVAKGGYSDETRALFQQKRKQYDSFTQDVENGLTVERGIQQALWRDSITSDTTDDEIITAARKYEVSTSTITAWIAERDAQQVTNEKIASGLLDPYSTGDRRKLDTAVYQAQTPEQQQRLSIAMAVDHGVAPKWIDTYLNREVTSGNIQAAGEFYMSYMQQAGSVPIAPNSDVLDQLELYRTFRKGASASAATEAVTAHFDNLDKDRIQANENAYGDKEYGSNMHNSPKDDVEKQLKNILKEHQGYREDTWWGMGADVPEFPPQLQQMIDTTGQKIFGNLENVDTTADRLFNVIQQSGWRVTMINGDPEWMANPPGRGPELTRLQLAQQLEGREFLVGGVWQEVDPEDVRFAQYREDANGNATWVLSLGGEIMIDRSGKKEAFAYDEPETDATDGPSTADVIAAQLLEEQRKEEKQRAAQKKAFRQRVLQGETADIEGM